MNDIQQFYTDRQKIFRFVRGQFPLFMLFSCSSFILGCIVIILFVTIKKVTLYESLAIMGLITACFISGFYTIYLYISLLNKVKYTDFFDNYLKLIEAINEDLEEAYLNKYSKILLEYTKFMGIYGMNEQEMSKKLPAFRGNKKYNKEEIEDIAKKHIATVKLIDEYVAERLLKELTK
ncbi:MAG: hypothetical protein WCL02_01420 [bacterium]